MEPPGRSGRSVVISLRASGTGILATAARISARRSSGGGYGVSSEETSGAYSEGVRTGRERLTNPARFAASMAVITAW